MAKKSSAAKKNAGRIAPAKPKTIEITYLSGVNIHDEDSLREAMDYMESVKEEIQPILDAIEITRKQATTYMHSHAMPLLQLEGRYWRKIVRMSRFWVGTDEQMPKPKPRGAESLKSLCQGKTAVVGKKKIPLWNFITKRVVDPAKIDIAVKSGYITQKQVNKAFLEAPQAPFIQRFDGEALDGDDDAEG